MDLNIGMVRMLIPTVKPHLPKVETAIAQSLDKIQLNTENGEKYAGYVIVKKDDGALILLCTFNEFNNVVRTVSQTTVTEFLCNLLDKAK